MTVVLPLDEKTARFPPGGSGGAKSSMEEYARACSDAVDEALEGWPVAQQTKNAAVSTGFIGTNELRSTLWTQSFDCSSRSSGVVLDDLLSNLKELFLADGDDLEKHAKQWDATFAGCSIVEQLSENNNDALVHWKFDASPLAGRDMMYVIHELEEEKQPSSQKGNESNNSNKKDGENDDDDDNNDWVLRLTYAYASVSDEWVKEHTQKSNGSGKEEEEIGHSSNIRRVRAFNCYPSCDRITVYNNNGNEKITLDHLMTTDVGGWIKPFCFNNLFKNALIKANAHECEAMREYALLLCKNKREEASDDNGKE